MTARYKILALHGYTQSGPSFSKKAAFLRKALRPLSIDLHFPTARREIRPADVSDPSERMKLQEAEEEGGEWQNFGWCVREEDGIKGLEESIEFLGRIMEEEGPFIGILGFSQGAAVAATLTSLLEKNNQDSGLPTNLGWRKINHPPVNFFISVSGFRWDFRKYDFLYPIQTSGLHIIGTADSVVSNERSMRLVESCTKSEVMTHPGGHFIPSASNRKQEMLEFIKKHLPNETAGTKIEPPATNGQTVANELHAVNGEFIANGLPN